MEVSLLLAKVFGMYMLLTGVVFLAKRKEVVRVIKQMYSQHAVVYVAAGGELLVGLFIVFLHPVWTGWPILVSLFGVAAVIEALFYLVFPYETVEKIIRKFVESSWLYDIISFLTALFGLALLWLGLVG